MRVPLLDLRRQNLPLEDELVDRFRRVVQSGQFILGEEVERFEANAAAMAGARFGVGMSSGTDAILVALMALGIGAGDEVICPSFTFFATAGCIARTGARPVFADSCAECFNIDPAGIERLIGPRTKAIIPVHLYGQAADLETILAIARRHRVAVVEDAAQAFGAGDQGKPVGGWGDIGTVSFFPTKNLGALGEAGLLVTNDAALAEKARLLRTHGMHPKYYHRMIGGNFRLDAVQAALLNVKLPHLAEYTAGRQRNACFYGRAFGGLRGARVEVITPATHPDRNHIVNQYTIRVRRGPGWDGTDSPRNALRKHLEQRGIASEIYYPLPLHAQECFRKFGPHPRLAVAEELSEEVLSLPVFPEMTEEERAAVADAITEFAGGGMNSGRLDRIVAGFAAQRVLVIGDLMLDEFVWGKVSRISPEAPVPVVNVTSESYYAGGAANVARNVREFTPATAVMGIAGTDRPGARLLGLLEAAGIDTSSVERDASVLTTVKTRIIARNQQVVRVDRERPAPLTAEQTERAIGRLDRALGEVDAIIVADYGKGYFSQPLADHICRAAREQGKILTVDPHPHTSLCWRNATAVKPNRAEAFSAAGVPPSDADEEPANDLALLEAARRLQSLWAPGSMLITLGQQGMLLFEGGAAPHRIPARAKEVFDVSGAGDTALAVFTLGLASGAAPAEAADLANRASGIAVGKLGTATVTIGELLAGCAGA